MNRHISWNIKFFFIIWSFFRWFWYESGQIHHFYVFWCPQRSRGVPEATYSECMETVRAFPCNPCIRCFWALTGRGITSKSVIFEWNVDIFRAFAAHLWVYRSRTRFQITSNHANINEFDTNAWKITECMETFRAIPCIWFLEGSGACRRSNMMYRGPRCIEILENVWKSYISHQISDQLSFWNIFAS